MINSFGLLDLSTTELFIILVIILVLFGGKKLPELSRSIGEALGEARKGLNSASGLHSDIKKEVDKTKAALKVKPGPKTKA